MWSPLGTGDEFPVFVWCQDHAGSELPAPLLEAFGGVNIEGADSAHWALEHEVEFYVGHAPGREVLHLAREVPWYDAMWNEFYKTRDTSTLVRQPCLSSPSTWTATLATLDKTLAAREGQHGQALSLGDEVGLTPWGDPLDLCQSKSCTQRWNEWCLTQDVQLSEKGWPSTDEVRLRYLDGETDTVHVWLARRRFHQEVVSDFLRKLANHVRRRAPKVRIALFGLTGQTAFGGVSIPRMLPTLDVLEAYNEGCARELLYTLRDEQASWCTVFPAKGDSDRGAHRLWEHWLRGGDGAIIWSDRKLKENPRYLERLAETVSAIRAVRASFPDWRPQTAGVALLHDDDSTALAWLRDALSDGPTWPRRFAGYQTEHGTRELAVNSSLRLFEDCGLLPGALPLDQLDAAHATRFPLLVAVHQLVVTRDNEARLAAYLKAGGKLLLRGPFALLGDRADEDCKAAEARLTKRFPKSVVRLEADASGEFDYNASRVEQSDGRVAAMRAQCTALLNETREWRLTSTPSVPLLIAQQRMADGSLLCAVIPNLPTGPLASLELQLSTKREVERIFPTDDQPQSHSQVRLAAGDAYVFVLRERQAR